MTTITVIMPAPIGNADIKAINPIKNRATSIIEPSTLDSEIIKRTIINSITPPSIPIRKN